MTEIRLAGLVAVVVMITGCAESSALIKNSSTSIRNDVFQELPNGGQVPAGYADLRITSSFKTHKAGAYSSAKDLHGTPEYKLLLNIDGQAVLLSGSLQKEHREQMKLIEPEAGDGVRYGFTKHLRLKAGAHRVVVALPDDGIVVEKEIVLVEGNATSLVIEPDYRSKPETRGPGAHSNRSFMEGIRSIELTLNGREI